VFADVSTVANSIPIVPRGVYRYRRRIFLGVFYASGVLVAVDTVVA
jgi:hypothetical protein